MKNKKNNTEYFIVKEIENPSQKMKLIWKSNLCVNRIWSIRSIGGYLEFQIFYWIMDSINTIFKWENYYNWDYWKLLPEYQFLHIIMK
jgi:hypothetical protein